MKQRLLERLHTTHVDQRTMQISKVLFGGQSFAVHTVMPDGSLEWGHYFNDLESAVRYIDGLRWAS